MNEVLDRKVRWRAASLHLAGLIWIPMYLATWVPTFWITDRIWNAISGTLPSQGAPGLREWVISIISIYCAIPTVSIGLTIILLLLIWKVSHDENPFVDLAGRSTINLLLSINLYSSILFVLGIMQPILHWLGLLFLLGLLLPFGHSIFAIFGAVSAWKGQVYRSPLTIKFLK